MKKLFSTVYETREHLDVRIETRNLRMVLISEKIQKFISRNDSSKDPPRYGNYQFLGGFLQTHAHLTSAKRKVRLSLGLNHGATAIAAV